jgi:CRISPR-associated protein Csm2
MATPFKGTIKSFDPGKGFGFISTDDGQSIFMHKNAVKSGTPVPGAAVEGAWEEGDKGPRAVTAKVRDSGVAQATSTASMKTYFSDAEKKRIRPELLCEEADGVAKKLYDDSSKQLNSAQLRRFFEEVRHLEKVVNTQGFEVARPLIRMLAAKAHYAHGRKNIGDVFKDFLAQHAKAIQDEPDFRAFVKFFEAIVGFYYFYNPKKSG